MGTAHHTLSYPECDRKHCSTHCNFDLAKRIGTIRQELLSGYSEVARYEKLRNQLRQFPNQPILDADYDVAAEHSHLCYSKRNRCPLALVLKPREPASIRILWVSSLKRFQFCPRQTSLAPALKDLVAVAEYLFRSRLSFFRMVCYI